MLFHSNCVGICVCVYLEITVKHEITDKKKFIIRKDIICHQLGFKMFQSNIPLKLQHWKSSTANI